MAAMTTALMVLLSGCGMSDDADAGAAVLRPMPSGQHPQERVGLTEWTIVVSSPRVRAGRLGFLVTNTGATVHDLVVHDAQGTWHSPDLDPGQQTWLVVRAAPRETLQLWCSMPGHRAQGMYTTITTRG
jgi:hypothetical protein